MIPEPYKRAARVPFASEPERIDYRISAFLKLYVVMPLALIAVGAVLTLVADWAWRAGHITTSQALLVGNALILICILIPYLMLLIGTVGALRRHRRERGDDGDA